MKPNIVSLLVSIFIVASIFSALIQNLGQLSMNASGAGGLANSPWPMFQGNLNHTGLSPYDTSTNTGQLKWSFTTGFVILSSPAIGSDGTIYVGSNDNKLHAINPDGIEKWNFTTGNSVKTIPAIGSDGTIYVGSHDNKLYAINPDGTEEWSFPTGHIVESSPAIGSDGTIYVGSHDTIFYAINPDGTEKWSFMTGDHIGRSSPAIGFDGTIYVGSWDNKLYAINPNGTEKWNFTTGHKIDYSTPAIGSDGTIYIGSWDKDLYAIYPNGSKKWNFTTGDRVDVSSPAIGLDGTIYVGSDDYKLYAINPDGTEKWSFPTGSWVWSSPAIGSDGLIYFGSTDNNLYAVYPNGSKKWSFTAGDWIMSSPAIGSDGTIYVGSHDGKLYAIGIPNQPPIAEAGPDQTVNESEPVNFIGCNSSDPDGIKLHYDFNTSDEHFIKEADGTNSDVHWDSTNGRIYFKSDRTDYVDERLVKILPQEFNENTCDWELTADFSISQGGWWTHAYPLFISNFTNTQLRFDPNQLNIAWERSDQAGPTRNNIGTWSREANGILNQFMKYHPAKLNTIYKAILSYDTCNKVIHAELYENGILIADGNYTIGSNPNDGFTFSKIGVSANGLKNVYPSIPSEPPVIGWTDNIQFNYYPLTYEWDFDASDGIDWNNPDAIGPKPTHTYGDDGVYTVTLKVTDSLGASDTDTCEITVQNLVPSIEDISVPSGSEGAPMTFSSTASDPGSDDLTFTWDWGDGTSQTTNTYYNNGATPEPVYDPFINEIKSPEGTYPFNAKDTVQHIYSCEGVYQLNLTVEDDDGGVAVYSTYVTVVGLAPPILYINISEDGKDIILNWTPVSILGIDHYLIYRSTSQIQFDFSSPWRNTSFHDDNGKNPLRTTWNDTNAAFPGNITNYEEEYYYIIRAVNAQGDASLTSRTVGKMTRQFVPGTSTFSLPLEPLEPKFTDWYVLEMNANYIRWMDPATHNWRKYGDGSFDKTIMKVGEGYEVNFIEQKNFTFTGMPGAMIKYDETLFGFDSTPLTGTADKLTAVVDPVSGNVELRWPQINGIDGYFVYNSSKRDGFWGDLDEDYYLLDMKSVGNENYTHVGAATKGTEQYYMVVPDPSPPYERGSSSYSIGVWTGDYDAGYDTFGLPLKLNATHPIDWYCEAIDHVWGMNYYNVPEQRWMWHKTIMPEGIYDVDVMMAEGYQVSTTSATKFTFVGV